MSCCRTMLQQYIGCCSRRSNESNYVHLRSPALEGQRLRARGPHQHLHGDVAEGHVREERLGAGDAGVRAACACARAAVRGSCPCVCVCDPVRICESVCTGDSICMCACACVCVHVCMRARMRAWPCRAALPIRLSGSFCGSAMRSPSRVSIFEVVRLLKLLGDQPLYSDCIHYQVMCWYVMVFIGIHYFL